MKPIILRCHKEITELLQLVNDMSNSLFLKSQSSVCNKESDKRARDVWPWQFLEYGYAPSDYPAAKMNDHFHIASELN